MLLAAMAAIAAIFASYIFLSMKYHNPYTSIFIFGKKGAGKSLWMVREMMRLHKKGWHIYTDMEDVVLPYVRIIKLKDLETYQPDPKSASSSMRSGSLWIPEILRASLQGSGIL